MKLKLTLITLLSLLMPLKGFSQDFLSIGDGYSCTRLADGKLHVAKVTEGGFQIYKKGAVSKAYEKETEKINKKLEVLKNLEKEVNKGTFDTKDENKLLGFIKALNNIESGPELTTKELRLANITNARNQLIQRKTNIKIFNKAIKDCDKQKYPGLDSIGAQIIPIFVRGTIESSAGYLIQVPKPTSKTGSLNLCIKFYDGFSGQPKTELYASSQTFSTNICTFSAALLGDSIIDCTGPVSKGLLGFYLQKTTFFERSPDPSSATVVNTMAQLAADQELYRFEVIPPKAAPGGDCKRLR